MSRSHFRHHVRMVCVYPSGDEEWYCPDCRKSFILSMPLQTPAVPVEGNLSCSWGKSLSGAYPLFSETPAKRAHREAGSIDDPYLKLWVDYLRTLE